MDKGSKSNKMTFRRYQHVEKLGTRETEGICDGVCHVFYKLDGTNASVWMEDGVLKCGSRNRELSEENDNQGFYNWVHGWGFRSLRRFFTENPNTKLFGEWLVPHSLKTYRDSAWRDFYVFDVVEEVGEEFTYLSYDKYEPMLEEFDINYIPPIATITYPTGEQLYRFLDKSGEFLVKDGEGKGEGIVIKNYDYTNYAGRQTWAKIVTNEFKEKHNREMGAPSVNNTDIVEMRIVREFLSDEYIKKEQHKIMLENDGFWNNSKLPQLFGVIQYEFVRDNIHLILKKFKQPTINFRTLNAMIIRKIKEVVL